VYSPHTLVGKLGEQPAASSTQRDVEGYRDVAYVVAELRVREGQRGRAGL